LPGFIRARDKIAFAIAQQQDMYDDTNQLAQRAPSRLYLRAVR
jgi:hypothetical protein